jgi:regulator of protease activity HflC (stomatin/prohibitin superfamily)
MGNLADSLFIGLGLWFALRVILTGFFTVDQNERAVLTTFGRASRRGAFTSLDDPLAAALRPDERERYAYPQVVVVPPGLHFKFPWQAVFKVSIATQTANIAFDPESVAANQSGKVLEAVTKDHLNTGLKGQIRYAVSERNLYAFLFGVKNPIVHVMGYFVAILRERIANFEAPVLADAPLASSHVPGISINDLRKNISEINRRMEEECRTSISRYGMGLDAALITEIEPPVDVESALAAINTAHNQVSSEISLADASADQKIVQSKKAVEIETLKAQAEVQLLKQLGEQLAILRKSGPDALNLYLRNVKLTLFKKARKVIVEGEA